GLPQSASVRFGASDKGFRTNNYAIFLTEDWAVKTDLSLSIGLRYEYYGPFTEKRSRMSNLDLAPDLSGVAVVLPRAQGRYSGEFPASLIRADRNNWAPRFGFNWQPIRKQPMTIRGGYGIYYNGSVYDQ